MAKTEKLCNPTPNRPYAIAFDPAESRTEQSHKASCDINNIMARYTKTGVLEHVRQYEGQYMDLPPGDFHDCQNKVAAAKSMFYELPSRLRAHFSNNPAQFLQFCAERENASADLLAIAEGYRKHAQGQAETTPHAQQDTKGSGMDADAKAASGDGQEVQSPDTHS